MRWKMTFARLPLVTAALLSLVGCSRSMQFSGSPSFASSMNFNGVETVCDALSGGSAGCSPHQGLRGSIFILPSEVGQRAENQHVDSYLEKGQQLGVQIQLSHLGIGVRSFTAG